jgi:ADP-heptose:LPS heptosyltransferase
VAVTTRAGTPPACLVLRALGLGDLLTAVPALRALRRGLPDHRITLALPAPLAPLARLTGAIDDVLPTAGLTAPGARRPGVPRGPIDIAVNLHGSGPQSHRLLAAPRPRTLIAYAHPDFPQVAGPHWDPAEHEVARWCRLLAGYGFRPDPDDLDLPAPGRWSPAPDAVVIHPGAAYPARRWPPERYAAVAAAVHAAGHDVVVTGGPGETGPARDVVTAAGLPAAADLSGRTPPLDLAATIAAARLVVCGDTGIAHLATAYRTPSVLLFGPTSPARWGPPPGRTEHTVLTGREGHEGDPRGRTPDPALLDIGVDRVVAAALSALSRLSGLSAPAGPAHGPAHGPAPTITSGRI